MTDSNLLKLNEQPDCDEQVTLLEGDAQAEIDGKRTRLQRYDTTRAG